MYVKQVCPMHKARMKSILQPFETLSDSSVRKHERSAGNMKSNFQVSDNAKTNYFNFEHDPGHGCGLWKIR